MLREGVTNAFYITIFNFNKEGKKRLFVRTNNASCHLYNYLTPNVLESVNKLSCYLILEGIIISIIISIKNIDTFFFEKISFKTYLEPITQTKINKIGVAPILLRRHYLFLRLTYVFLRSNPAILFI
jgi:hypothetical protein